MCLDLRRVPELRGQQLDQHLRGMRGDAPVEDWVEGDPEGVAFDRDAIDSRLHAFDEQARSAARHLAEAIDVILTDCYDDSEEATAFLTVLGDEIDFPVPATLLGAPVVVRA